MYIQRFEKNVSRAGTTTYAEDFITSLKIFRPNFADNFMRVRQRYTQSAYRISITEPL